MGRMMGVGVAALLTLGFCTAGVGCSSGARTEAPAEYRTTGTVGAASAREGGQTALYTGQVLPILKANCYRCHGGMNHRGGLNLQTQAGMMKGGKNGRDVIPGDPARSLLVMLMRHEGPADHPMPMPPSPRPKLPDADISVVARWVKEGAIMPLDAEKP